MPVRPVVLLGSERFGCYAPLMPDAPVPLPLTILRALAEETHQRLELATRIEHPGESGRAREQVQTAFIEQLVPSSFGVSTGFVVDALGGKSRQVDIVVYRTDYAPVFEIGRVKHFLVESVVAVLEVKAAISKEAVLTQALNNVASVKALDRTNRGRNWILSERELVRPMDRDQDRDQIFSAVVTERSLTNFVEPYSTWLGAHEPREWPNLYIDVARFSALYRYPWSEPDGRVRSAVGTDSMRAEMLSIHLSEPSTKPPLVVLGFELINWFRVVPRIDFSMMDYFPLGTHKHQNYPLPGLGDGPHPQGH